jgi:hypothetical protein
MSAYFGAVSIHDKGGRRLRAFHVTTLETDTEGREQLGWALVPAVDHEDAARLVRKRWPQLSVLDTSEAAI